MQEAGRRWERMPSSGESPLTAPAGGPGVGSRRTRGAEHQVPLPRASPHNEGLTLPPAPCPPCQMGCLKASPAHFTPLLKSWGVFLQPGQRRCFHREKTCSGRSCDTRTTGLSHPKAPHAPALCTLSPDVLHSEPIRLTWGRSTCWKEPHRKYFKLCRPHPHSLCCTVFRFGWVFFIILFKLQIPLSF